MNQLLTEKTGKPPRRGRGKTPTFSLLLYTEHIRILDRGRAERGLKRAPFLRVLTDLEGRSPRVTPYPNGPGHRGIGTSKEAAAACSLWSSGLRVRCLLLLTTGPLTTDEVAARLQLDYQQVQPRISELKALGLIESSGVRSTSLLGKPCLIWRVVRSALPRSSPASARASFSANDARVRQGQKDGTREGGTETANPEWLQHLDTHPHFPITGIRIFGRSSVPFQTQRKSFGT